MNIDNLRAFIEKSAHSPLHNYVVPGVTSWLFGERGLRGCVRVFTSDRKHIEDVTPHSHRFDFHAIVLAGTVRNRIWTKRPSSCADFYAECDLTYGGAPGSYEIREGNVGRWEPTDRTYEVGESYAMRAHEIHSIYFSRGAKVLVFEGPTTRTVSQILQPVVDGRMVQTFRVEPWMFQSEKEAPTL